MKSPSSTSSHISIDRRHTLSGRKTIDWFFANRKWIRTGNRFVEAAWAERELPLEEAPLRFLFLAPKRFHKLAHDRNRVRRWLRAAIVEEKAFGRIEQLMGETKRQMLIMMRVTKPVQYVEWNILLDEVHRIAKKMSESS